MLSNSVVLAALVLIATQLRGSEPTVALEFSNQDGSITFELPTASVGMFFSKNKMPLGELKPILASNNGRLKYVLSGIAPDDKSRKQARTRRSLIIEVFDQQTAMVIDEIEKNCSLSDEQLAKIELAANGECVRLKKLLTRLEQLTINPNDIPADEFQRLCEEVYDVNCVIADGPLRGDSLLYAICKATLDSDQNSTLRAFYVQPLLKILSDKGVTSDQSQLQRLEQAIRKENLDPFLLRNSYGQQYETLIGLGEKRLALILQPEQLIALKSLGQSEYRITLSRSKLNKRPSALVK